MPILFDSTNEIGERGIGIWVIFTDSYYYNFDYSNYYF